ncbi:MAG: hypothetical protein A3E68_02620 [Candidatus Levybacteria bacterium RIFCSPHIGHO2_12_FULL_39_39]|nr:MAG: hypothetical protein UT20_C0038G0008 [Candidatus Levybacteria bacterium GW2011_GWA1_39_11]OGH25743.1 MAG: hypothetical protein A3E68_02620 [Candidatus Levybacteria bacterium RIFCSPHIGHO2_12_FULL_39_39]
MGAETCRRPRSFLRFCKLRLEDWDSRNKLEEFFAEESRNGLDANDTNGTGDHESPEELSCATGEDMRQRLENQCARYIKLSLTGRLTREWMRFGQKHQDKIIEYHSLKSRG